MSLCIKMAGRNLRRNHSRTLLTLLALVVPLCFMIVYAGINRGFISELAANMTDLTLGEYQIHDTAYLADRSIYDTIPHYDPLLAMLRQQGRQAAPRWYGYGLLANDAHHKSVGVEILAVDLEREPRVTTLLQPKHFYAGAPLTGRTTTLPSPRGASLVVEEIVLGKKVAMGLHAEVGDLLVLMAAAADGSIGNELFRVVGILNNIGDPLDRTRVIIPKSGYIRLFAFDPAHAHEIAIGRTEEPDPDFANRLLPLLPKNLTLDPWEKLAPLVADMIAWVGVATLIIMGILYTIAALVVVNAVLMAVFERTREFGIMKALGSSPGQIVMLVVSETAILALLASLGGWILGGLLNLYFMKIGLDLSPFLPNGFDIMGTSIDPVIHSRHHASIYLLPTALLFLMAFLAALYPAIKAARLQPVEAIYKR